MGFRFQKRIRIFKGLTLNLSKSGSSWTLGYRANGGRWVWWLGCRHKSQFFSWSAEPRVELVWSKYSSEPISRKTPAFWLPLPNPGPSAKPKPEFTLRKPRIKPA